MSAIKKRFEVLDIFRGIFASMIVFFHLAPFTDTRLIKNSFINNSDLFVDFFFVLSGFVIAYSYQDIPDGARLGQFLKKRFWRLYPLHLTMLVAFFLVETVKQSASSYVHVNQLNNPNNNILSFFSSLFLLNSVKVPTVNDVSWNIPSWSISAEMISYLLFGTLMLVISASPAVRRLKNIFYLLIVLLAFFTLVILTGEGRITYSYDFGFLRGIIGFFSGTLCFGIYQFYHKKLESLSGTIFSFAEIFTVVLTVGMICNAERLRHQALLFETLFVLSILIFAFEKGIVSRNLKKSGFLLNAGKYSYSIYMSHALCLSIFNVLFIRLLHFSPASYSYLVFFNYILIYKISKWSYEKIEMRFSSAAKRVAPSGRTWEHRRVRERAYAES